MLGEFLAVSVLSGFMQIRDEELYHRCPEATKGK